MVSLRTLQYVSTAAGLFSCCFAIVPLQIGHGNQTPLHPSGRDNREISAAPLWASRVTALCVGTLLPMLLSPTPCLQPQRLLGTPHPMRPSPQARKWDLGRHAAPASPSVASALRAPRVLAVPANFCCTYAALVFLSE